MQITDSKKSYLNSLVFDKECYEKLYSPTEKIAWKIIGGEASKYEHIPVSLCKKFYLVPAGFLGSIAMTIYRLFFLTLSLPWKSLSLKAEIHRMFFIFLRGALRTYAHALMPFNEKKAAFMIQENDFQIQGLFNHYGNAKNKDKFLNQLLEDFSKLDLSDQIQAFFSIYDVQEEDQKQIKEKKLADGIHIFSIGDLVRKNVQQKFRDFVERNLQKIEDKKATSEKLSELLLDWPTREIIPNKEDREIMVKIASLLSEQGDHDTNWIKESVDDIILSSLSCEVYTDIFSLVDNFAETPKADRFLKVLVKDLLKLFNAFRLNDKGNSKSYTESEYKRREQFYLSMISYAYSCIKDKNDFENPLAEEKSDQIRSDQIKFIIIKNLPSEVQKIIEFLQNVNKIYLQKANKGEAEFVKENISSLFSTENNSFIAIRKKYKRLILQFHPDRCNEEYRKYYLDATNRLLTIYKLYSS